MELGHLAALPAGRRLADDSHAQVFVAVDTRQFRIPLDFSQHFKPTMGSAVVLDGHTFFLDDARTSAEWAQEQLKRMGIKDGGSTAAWSPFVVLPVGCRMRLQRYVDIKSGCAPPLPFQPIVDLSQDPSVRRASPS
mmetsp:Transcript_19671/g.55934  ORF Transcript_19671/g.55934 Transcript_19671/m.55934 type:complete len:136 (+) Transcript_19671:236-643(+)